MRILQAVPKMNVGGVERGVLDIACYYQHKEDDILVASGGGRLVKELESYGARHIRLNIFKKSLTSLFLIKPLKKLLIKEKIDIVHARSRVPAWISFFATRGTDTHFITTAHGKYSVKPSSAIMGWGKFVICPSRLIARHMQEAFGVDADRIIIVDRWVDLDKFSFREKEPEPGRITLMSVGRISPTKGYEYLIEAMRRIVRTNPYVNLQIVGSADDSKARYLNSLKSMVNRYSLGYNVTFTGYRPDVEKLLTCAHMLIMPSVIEESFGRVVVEAFAVGVPVVATKLGGMAEIIEHGKDGLLVPARDEEALSDAILTLLEDRAYAKTIAANARRKAEQKYSLNGCIAQVNDVYKKTLAFRRILVVKISSLGDLVLIIPSLKALKEQYPQSHITLLTLKKYTPLFYECPYVDAVHGLDENYKRFPHILKTASQLRRKAFDYSIDFQNSKASGLISFLTMPRKSYGFSRKFGFLYTSKARFPRDKSVGPLHSQERILRLLGISLTEKRLSSWKRQPQDISHLNLSEPNYIGINISASAKWETKNWPIEHIRRFIELSHKEMPRYTVVFLGDEASVARAQGIEQSLKAKVVDLCGKTNINELIEVMRRLHLFITPDTATLHLAQSLGIPTIALFGPTDPRAHTVPAKNLHVMVSKSPCAPCYKWSCPTFECMKGIEPQDVLSEARKLLAGR